MLNSILWKELRDLLPLAVVAIGVEGLLFSVAVQQSPDTVRYDPRIVLPFLYMLGFLFPIVLGLWQIAREAFGNHYQFLLHRPLKRTKIFGIKLIFGAAACFLVIDAPLITFALWEDRHLHRAWDVSPLSIMFPLCCDLFLLYLAAFLSALRPGRWYGSQFLPLLGAILLFVVLQVVGGVSSWWWYAAMLAVLPLEICYAIAILYVAQARDYS